MPGQGVVSIGANQWQVDLANTYWELFQGLSGLSGMPAGTGMLFDLGYEHTSQVTTEEMLFNIDIAFISVSQEVVDIARDVAPGNVVTSGVPASYFLEVNGGELAIVEVGDQVSMAFFLGELPMQVVPWADTLQQVLASVLIMGFVMWASRRIAKPLVEHDNPGVSDTRYRGLIEAYGEWAVNSAIAICPLNDAECVEREARRLYESRFFRGGVFLRSASGGAEGK